METWLRRVRGALGMGVTWALGWAPIGALFGLALGLMAGGLPLGTVALNFFKLFAVMGFLGGTTFAGVLRFAEGHHRFEELSLPRFAALGALGGLILGLVAVGGGILGPSLTWLDVAVAAVPTLLGGGSAAGMLVLARKADDPKALQAP